MAAVVKHALLLTLHLSLLFLFLGAAAAMPGGWTEITDLSDPALVAIAKFSVAEHDKVANSKLEFQSVVEASMQVVEGTNYKLVIAAVDGGLLKNYEATVWEQLPRAPQGSLLQLISFRRLG